MALLAFANVRGMSLGANAALSGAALEPIEHGVAMNLIWNGNFGVVVVEMAQIAMPVGLSPHVPQEKAQSETGAFTRVTALTGPHKGTTRRPDTARLRPS